MKKIHYSNFINYLLLILSNRKALYTLADQIGDHWINRHKLKQLKPDEILDQIAILLGLEGGPKSNKKNDLSQLLNIALLGKKYFYGKAILYVVRKLLRKIYR